MAGVGVAGVGNVVSGGVSFDVRAGDNVGVVGVVGAVGAGVGVGVCGVAVVAVAGGGVKVVAGAGLIFRKLSIVLISSPVCTEICTGDNP